MIYVDTARCTGCGVCLRICPQGAIELRDGRAHVLQEQCSGCEECLSACPEKAILALTEEQCQESALPVSVSAARTPTRTVKPLPAVVAVSTLLSLGRIVLPRLLELALDRKLRLLSPKSAARSSHKASGAGRRHRWRGGERGA